MHRTFLVVALLALGLSARAASVDRPIQLGGAFVEFDNTSGRWTIGNDTVRFTVELARQGSIRLPGLSIGDTQDPVTIGDEPEALITLAGETVRLGAPGSGFVLERVDPSEGTHFVALALRFLAQDRGLAATRRYVVYPGAAAVEMWTEVETLDDERHVIENLNAYDMAVPPGAIDSVLGLVVPASEGGSFTGRTRSLEPGERMDLGSPTLSTEHAMPYFSVGNAHRRVFSGLLWSGGWSASLDRRGDVLHISMGLPDMSAWVSPGHPLEGPHAFIGVTWDVPGADITAVIGNAFPQDCAASPTTRADAA